MTQFSVAFEHGAAREFRRLPEAVRGRLYVAFEMLEVDPYRPRPGCDIRALQGAGGARAIRVGEYRGVFEVKGDVVRFTRFGHRKRVYVR